MKLLFHFLAKNYKIVYTKQSMIITSTQNPKIKELKKLMKDKSLIFFDNPKLIEEAVLSGNNLLYIIKKEGYVGKADYGGAELIDVDEKVFGAFCTTVNSQGIVGVVKLQNRVIQPPRGNFLVLDELQDPGNVGTLIRSALGANFLDIYLLNSVNISNEKLIRSSMGAIFKTRIYQVSKDEFISNYKKWNKPLYVCDMGGENIYKTTVSNDAGIVVGNEGNGVSNEINNISTGAISIPMQNGLESLNAGVSGSIIMYQISNC